MERELINREKEPRIIQQKSRPGGGLMNIADNRTNPDQRLIGGMKVAQAKSMNNVVSQPVIQRVGEANGKFVFIPNILVGQYMSRIPYSPQTIQFTTYGGGEILSAGFNGCFMMAFRFRTANPALPALFDPNTVPPHPYVMDSYRFVAHVSNDIKAAVFDAEARRLIIIDALFRPYRNGDKENRYLSGASPAGENAFTGGMTLTSSGWTGRVYKQKRISTTGAPLTGLDVNAGLFRWEIRKHKDIPLEQMKRYTKASKAYIYAHIIADDNITQQEKATANRLLLSLGKDAINLAHKQLVCYSNIYEKTVAGILASFL